MFYLHMLSPYSPKKYIYICINNVALLFSVVLAHASGGGIMTFEDCKADIQGGGLWSGHGAGNAKKSMVGMLVPLKGGRDR